MNSRLTGQLNIALLPPNQNFTLRAMVSPGRTLRYQGRERERALRATVCFSMERARPSDAADVYIKTSNDL